MEPLRKPDIPQGKESGTPANEPEALRDKIRVLYVEDASFQARLVKHKLSEAGYSVDIARDGAEGLQKIREGSFDLLAIDHAMPVYQGIEIIRILSSEGKMPPTIMVTGSGNESVAVEALKLGASDYIIKDLEGHYIQLLPAVIEKALLRHKLIQEKQTMSVRLLESEEKYRTMFESIADAICVIDRDSGKILDVNSAAVKLYGYSRSDLLSMSFTSFKVESKDRRRAVASGKQQTEYHKRKDGAIFPVEIGSSPITLKDTACEIKTIRDMSERKRYETNLQRKMEEQRVLLQSIPAMVYFKKRDLTYITANKAFCEFSGISRHELVGKSDYDVYRPNEAERFRKLDTQVMVTGEPILNQEEPVTDSFGNTKWMLITKVPYRDENGNVIGMVGMASDVSEHKQMQEHIRSRDAILEAAGYTAEKFLKAYNWEEAAKEALARIGTVLQIGRAYLFENHITSGGRLYMDLRVEWCDEHLHPLSGRKDIEKVTYSDAGLTRWMEELSQGRSISSAVADLSEDEQQSALLNDVHSVSVLPIFVGNYWWGFLGFDRDGKDVLDWSDPELESLRVIANIIGSVIQRQRAQTALQRSEERLQLALNAADIGLWDWDVANGDVVHDKRWSAFLGHSQFDMGERLKTWEWLIHPEDLPLVKERLQQHISGHTSLYESEHRMLTKSGEWRWFQDRGKIVVRENNQPPTRVTGTFLDITDRKMTEQQVKLQSNALRAAANGIVITEPDGTIVWVNPAFTRLTGYEAHEVIGKNPNILKSGEQDPALYSDLWNTIKSGRVWQGELVNKRKNGELYTEEITITPVLDSKRNIMHFIAIKLDITQRKQAEQELIDAKLRAERHEKLKDAFIANISHEIRTPLNIILGHSSLIAELYKETADDNERNCFAAIESAGRRLIQTVDSIVIMSRLQAGDIEIQQSEIHISTLVDSIVHEMSLIAESKQLDLEFEDDTEDCIVHGDEYFYGQAIKHLVDNAIKFTHKGGVKVRLYQSDDTFQLAIEDSGIGIGEAYLPHLYEPYSQEDSGYSRAYEGVGLGLTLVYLYLKANAAAIDVESTKGSGTTFTITFPGKDELQTVEPNGSDELIKEFAIANLRHSFSSK
ncbi:MAG: hypothetical protein CL946_02440 [Ectothiorhodospiraceae bacterium]|nr:hypothetical protein [Ectothiorhodospiraceae bacterium]